MNRRGFIGAMLGAAAATALPSEVWPFRKIFLPAQKALTMGDINAICFEEFGKAIPDLYYASTPWHLTPRRGLGRVVAFCLPGKTGSI